MRARSGVDLVVLVCYAAVSVAYFGWGVLPHPGRVVIGTGHDPQIFVWSFAWWPHAIGSWTNPFFTHAIFAPDGVNMAWTASAPGLALVFAPLTVAFGPVASYNVAALLLPALAAWTAYLLCRYLTGSVWAALVGGYLFGFSAAVLRQQLFGHLHVTGVFLLPLVALVVVRHVRGELSGRGLAWRLGLLLGLQLWISTEFTLTCTVVLALGLLLAFGLVPDARRRLVASVRPILLGYAIGAVVALPLLVYALLGFVRGSFVDREASGVDVLNFFVPTGVIGIGGSSLPSLSGDLPSGGASAYLGLPTLLVVGAFALRARRAPSARLLVASLAATATVALGTTLEVDGHELLPLPWWHAAAHLPGLNNALPFRFTTYASLAAAIVVASWTATTKGRIYSRPYLLPALAVAALVPAVWQTSYPSFRPAHPERLPFFSDGLYEHCILRGETVAIFPFGAGGDSMIWQAEAGFRFRLAADGLQPVPLYGKPLTRFDADGVVWELNFIDFGRPTIERLLAFAAIHHVDRVLTVESYGYPSRAQMRRFGPTQRVGGMLVAPACGHRSLAARDLSSFVGTYLRQQRRQPPRIGYCLGLNFNLVPRGLDPAGPLQGARRAIYVAGQGLTCAAPPTGYKRRGFAPVELSVPPHTYAFYGP